MKRRWRTMLGLLLSVAFASPVAAADGLLPSPYDILRDRGLDTPLLDAVPYCVPPGPNRAANGGGSGMTTQRRKR